LNRLNKILAETTGWEVGIGTGTNDDESVLLALLNNKRFPSRLGCVKRSNLDYLEEAGYCFNDAFGSYAFADKPTFTQDFLGKRFGLLPLSILKISICDQYSSLEFIGYD